MFKAKMSWEVDRSTDIYRADLAWGIPKESLSFLLLTKTFSVLVWFIAVLKDLLQVLHSQVNWLSLLHVFFKLWCYAVRLSLYTGKFDELYMFNVTKFFGLIWLIIRVFQRKY